MAEVMAAAEAKSEGGVVAIAELGAVVALAMGVEAYKVTATDVKAYMKVAESHGHTITAAEAKETEVEVEGEAGSTEEQNTGEEEDDEKVVEGGEVEVEHKLRS